MKTAKVAEFPRCDVCGKEAARYDGKTKWGPWAYMCQKCFEKFGVGWGMGRGQKLELERR